MKPFAALLMAIAFLLSCTTDESRDKFLDIEAGDGWTGYDRVLVVAESGGKQDTLWNRKIDHIGDLNRVPVKVHTGADIEIMIWGFDSLGKTIYQAVRHFKSDGAATFVDTIYDAQIAAQKIIAVPDSLTLRRGDDPALLRVKVWPPYANRELTIAYADEFLSEPRPVPGENLAWLIPPRKKGGGWVALHGKGAPQASLLVNVKVLGSNRSELGALHFSSGALSPAWDPAHYDFVLRLGFPDSLVQLEGTVQDTASRLTINGLPGPEIEQRFPVGQSMGFEILVTAEGGAISRYSVRVIREYSSNALLKRIMVSSGRIDTLVQGQEYVDTVSHAVSTLVIGPKAEDPNAILTVDAMPLPDGLNSSPIALRDGDNPIKVTVSAQDGKTKKTYSLTVVRLSQLTRFLRLGALSAALDSFETPLQKPLTLVSDPHMGFTWIGWQSADGNVMIADPASRTTEVTLLNGSGIVEMIYDTAAYQVLIAGSSGGSISPASFAQPCKHFAEYSINAVDSLGYDFVSWAAKPPENAIIADAKARNTKVGFKGSCALQAGFAKEKYEMTLSSEGEGVGSIAPSGRVSLAFGDTLRLTAIPAVGSHFAGWKISGPASVDASLPNARLTATGNASVIGMFALDEFVIPLTVLPAEGEGTLSPAMQIAKYAQWYSITASPGPTSHFIRWIAAGGVTFEDASKPTTRFTTKGAGSIRAEFDANHLLLTVGGFSECPTTPMGSSWVRQGAVNSITAPQTCTRRYSICTDYLKFLRFEIGLGNPVIESPQSPTTNVILNDGAGTVNAVYAVVTHTCTL
jgi:hypothetical protein